MRYRNQAIEAIIVTVIALIVFGAVSGIFGDVADDMVADGVDATVVSLTRLIPAIIAIAIGVGAYRRITGQVTQPM